MSPEPGAVEPTAEVTLPRRSRSNHLEPQLRERYGVGDATPFAAFGDVTGPRADRAAAAAFHDGTAQARRG